MSPTPEQADLFGRLRETYRLGQDPAVLEAERRVLGSDYGGHGYTTVAQARGLMEALGLGAESSLLELGAGAGWPGRFMAKTSGCRVTLADVPSEGLAAARLRATTEGIDAQVVVASGTSLPFPEAWFDAVSHTDVLC